MSVRGGAVTVLVPLVLGAVAPGVGAGVVAPVLVTGVVVPAVVVPEVLEATPGTVVVLPVPAPGAGAVPRAVVTGAVAPAATVPVPVTVPAPVGVGEPAGIVVVGTVVGALWVRVAPGSPVVAVPVAPAPLVAVPVLPVPVAARDEAVLRVVVVRLVAPVVVGVASVEDVGCAAG
jgi:hypothetical protein